MYPNHMLKVPSGIPVPPFVDRREPLTGPMPQLIGGLCGVSLTLRGGWMRSREAHPGNGDAGEPDVLRKHESVLFPPLRSAAH